MFTHKEIDQLIYEDAAHTIENAGWIDRFYELWMERYHALNIVKSPSDVIRPGRDLLLNVLKSYSFDEMHLFKIHEGANVYALLTDKGEGYWAYEFIIINQEAPDRVSSGCNTVEELKDHFDNKEPILEIPLPNDRKYAED